MANWQFVYRDKYDLYVSNAQILIPLLFTVERLLIKAVAQPVTNPGSLIQFPFVPGFGMVTGEAQSLRTGLQFLRFSAEFPYRLTFEPSRRLDELDLSIWLDTMPIYPDQPNPSATAGTTTNIAAALTSTTLLAANGNRKGASIYNNSIATLYIGFGTTVTTTAFAEKITANSLWEMPLDYDGPISGVWSAASGNALVTEFT